MYPDQKPVENVLSVNLRALRKKMGISQEELAARMGINRGNIASYENGSAEPKMAYMVKFSELFDVPLIDLATRNLSNPEASGPGNRHPSVSASDQNNLEQFSSRAGELQAVLAGFNSYHRYKMKSLDALPKDLQMMVINFEELFEVADVLMKAHLDLIEFTKKRFL